MTEGIADYAFVERLGGGNHGTYFLARPPDRLGVADEIVAVKVLDANASEADFARIANELRVLHAVASDFLVRLYDAGNDGGRLFYAMPYYVEGSLEAASTLSTEQRARVMVDAARGAHDLHEAGIVHRDIKPTNVLLDAGRGRLGDLGLARLISSDAKATGMGPVGSIEYMSPDAVLGKPATRGTDLWALGVTLHHSLTGTGVYEGIPDTNVMDAFSHVLRTPPALSAELPEAYRTVVERCLGLRDGYSTAAEMADELEATTT